MASVEEGVGSGAEAHNLRCGEEGRGAEAVAKGDALVSVDGEDVGTGCTAEALRALLLGRPGTTVRLRLARGHGVGGEFAWEVVLTR